MGFTMVNEDFLIQSSCLVNVFHLYLMCTVIRGGKRALQFGSRGSGAVPEENRQVEIIVTSLVLFKFFIFY
jgi:hypothetical protein